MTMKKTVLILVTATICSLYIQATTPIYPLKKSITPLELLTKMYLRDSIQISSIDSIYFDKYYAVLIEIDTATREYSFRRNDIVDASELGPISLDQIMNKWGIEVDFIVEDESELFGWTIYYRNIDPDPGMPDKGAMHFTPGGRSLTMDFPIVNGKESKLIYFADEYIKNFFNAEGE